MSKEPIDHWLDDVQFENFRLSFKPTALHLELLRAEIQRMESMTVTEEGSGDLQRTVSRLDCLKQDLISLQNYGGLVARLVEIRDRMREQGVAAFRPEEANEIYDDCHSWIQVVKHQQRSRQHANLAYMRRFWPIADQARRRQMVRLFATYGKNRLLWGAFYFGFSAPIKLARWTGRTNTKLK